MTSIKKNKIYFGAPTIGKEEIVAITKVMKSGWLGFGRVSRDFEKKTAKYVDSENAIAVSSCTAALHLALIVSGIKKGDEVITTPLTFIATIRAIEMAGAKPILADIDENTLNIDPNNIEAKITIKTKAIIPVHFGGMPCDLKEIFAIAKKFNLKIIEDAAHALGSEYNGKKIGSFKESVTCFSFYPNKNITSIEGGMLTFYKDSLINKLDQLRMSGMSSGAWNRFSDKNDYKPPVVVDEGFKYNINDVNSAIGIVQLKKLKKFLDSRRKQAKVYDKYFTDKDYLNTQSRKHDDSMQIKHSYHLYTLTLNPKKFEKSRDDILREIRHAGIGVVIHYKPINKMPYFIEKYGEISNLDNSNFVGDNIMSLPISPKYKIKDIEKVAKKIVSILEKNLL